MKRFLRIGWIYLNLDEWLVTELENKTTILKLAIPYNSTILQWLQN